MSSGVDQLKLPGNAAKSVEERNIPWSQQVDEASYENLASPTSEDNSGISQSNMQFQHPPFNLKENQNSTWNNFKTRKSIGNLDPNKKYGKSAYYNNLRREDFQPNSWNINNSKRSIADNSTGKIIRASRQEELNISESFDNRTTVNDMNNIKKISITHPVVVPKKTTWASIASQPAKNTSKTILMSSSQKKKGPGMPPPPMVPGKHDLDVNSWDVPNNNQPPVPSPPTPIETSTDLNPNSSSDPDVAVYLCEKERKNDDLIKEENRSNYNNSNFGRLRNSPNGHTRKNWTVQLPVQMQQPRQTSGGFNLQVRRNDFSRKTQYSNSRSDHESTSLEYRDENSPRNVELTSNVNDLSNDTSQAVLDELRDKNNYNPAELDLEIATSARFFVIKSYSEDDIHRSIKYEIWCSTDHGNKRLDDAFKERKKEGGNIMLFFSVNGSGHFCGVAQMMTAVDYNSTSSVWSQDKWKGKFKVKWIYVKDVPNIELRHIRLENNDNKAVTNSRDTQEVPNAKGIEVLEILHSYKHATSIFDDFYHYEKKQEEEVSSKRPSVVDNASLGQGQFPLTRNYHRQQDDWNRDRDSRTSSKYVGTNYRERNRTNYINNFNDYMGRISQKHEIVRRDNERVHPKHSNREREFSEEVSKNEQRFRSGQRETEKDNEYLDRTRLADY